MNLLFSCIGQRGYIADFFRPHLIETDRIIGTGNSRWTPGFTRCDEAFILPDITSPTYTTAVLDLCKNESVDAVLSFNDVDVVTLSNAHDEFKRIGTKLVMPCAEAAEVAYDKYRTYEFLIDNKIPTPRTALTPSEAADFSFPVFVKPRRGSGSLDTFVARSSSEMLSLYSYRPDMIIQEALTGEPINIDLCSDFDGYPIGISTWKKLRSRLGETERAETFRDSAVIDFALSLGKSLRATGPMDIDAFLQPSGIVVLEVNTRFGGGYPVSHLAGADFPRLILDLIRFGKAEADHTFNSGVVMMKRLEIIGGPAGPFFRDDLGIRE